MILRLENFKGIAPRFASHLVPENVAQVARNCKLLSGALEPYADPLDVLVSIGAQTSVFLYGNTWLRWTTDVDVVKSAVADDQYDRIYYTGDGVPKVTSSSLIGAGFPADYYTLGIPVPAVAIVATPVALSAYSAAATYAKDDLVTESGSDYLCIDAIGTPEAFNAARWQLLSPTDRESRIYAYTYVSTFGEEGPPKIPDVLSSAVTEVYPTQGVSLSLMSVAPAGDYNITKKYIYRTNLGSVSTEYQFVDEVAIGTTTYSDTKKSYELGEVMVSQLWDAPPTDLKGIVAMPNGIIAGFRGNELCFCVPYQPHAWPLSYRYPVDSPIVSLGVYGNTVVVTTEGMPYTATGSDPSSMTPQRLEVGFSCVSKRGTVDMGTSIIYPSPVGLVLAGPGSMEIITSTLMTKDEWEVYNPSSIVAYRYGGYYVAFYDNGTQGGFVFSPSTGDFVEIDLYATAGFYDQSDGKLYLVVDENLVQWDAGATKMTQEWEGPDRISSHPINMAYGQVFAEAYPVTFKYYADGVLKHTQSVANSKPFRLPGGYKAEIHKARVSGAKTIKRAFVAQSIDELKQV